MLDVHPNPAVLGDDDAEALVVPPIVAMAVQQHLPVDGQRGWFRVVDVVVEVVEDEEEGGSVDHRHRRTVRPAREEPVADVVPFE